MISKLIKRIKNKRSSIIEPFKPVCVEVHAKQSKISANDTAKLINKLFTDKRFADANKTFIYGGYIKRYISLKKVVKHFKGDSTVTVVTLDGHKYRCGKKLSINIYL